MIETDLAKNLAKVLTRPVTLTSLSAKQQEIAETWNTSSLIGEYKETLPTLLPSPVNMQPTPFENVETPDLGTPDVPNRVLNNYH